MKTPPTNPHSYRNHVIGALCDDLLTGSRTTHALRQIAVEKHREAIHERRNQD